MFLILAILLSLFYTWYFYMVRFNRNNFIKANTKVLIVTAHPDDECMFFAPTILNLLKHDCCVYLLCLSSGGFCDESSIRKQELRESCKTLGIPAGNLVIIEHSQLPDNPHNKWSRLKVSSIILKYIRHLSATVVVSFDEYGISGHLNHIAVCEGVKYLNQKDCEVFLLKSVFLLQKYLGFLLVPLYYFCGKFHYVSTFHDVKTIWKSMKEHKSQFVWFRKLYIVFSQYVYINTFTKL
ncbi:N-acetylglucosaminyl-phosphatidylinositol de-N-acetylase-like isoform X2 [Argiope bruennichi]|uniref:N-acetylglucosaminyl-phosphatidylinositol de-N-acetylase-like isoform X2 n=1 Tax=Argiope bruennichi TaxID=94029 RepID=UPI0024948C9E|nr:N-acetylglucosaminyl-phosphatidylinositol de-N-acetylase-like isoform X2 [Argiope bruennichi]